MLQHSVQEYRTVKAWRHELAAQWGGDPIAEGPEKLRALETFCEFTGDDPDTIIQRCFRVRKSDGERVISVKWRAHYAQKIKEFRERDSAVRSFGRDVLSFMIHNGVMVQV